MRIKKREAEQQKEKELTEIGRRISGLSRLQSEYYEKYVLGDWRKEDFEREKEKRTGEPKRKANCHL